MNWYYAVGEQQVGPISKAELQALVKAKKINASTRVWRPGMEKWLELDQIVKRSSQAGSVTKQVTAALKEAQCCQCGQAFSEEEMIRFAESWVCAACKPVFVQKLKEGVTVAGVLDYAGFWIRFGAIFIDGIIISVVYLMIHIPLVIFMTAGVEKLSVFATSQILTTLIQFVFPAAYTTWFLGKYSATPGKMACKIKVVTADGGRVSYARALGRHFAKWISWMILGIGFIMAVFDEQNRTLHDRICDTRVVRK
jgi:uncharacterized RDD family membrane protein YckC